MELPSSIRKEIYDEQKRKAMMQQLKEKDKEEAKLRLQRIMQQLSPTRKSDA